MIPGAGSAPVSRSVIVGALWVSAGVVLLPLLLGLPVDGDKAFALIVGLPALVLLAGYRIGPVSKMSPTLDRVFLGWFVVAVLLACINAAHPARAWVAAASLLFSLSIFWVVRRVAQYPNLRSWLVLSVAASGALGVVAIWVAMLAGSNAGRVPFYANARILGLHLFPCAMAAIGWLLLFAESRRQKLLGGLLAVITWTGLAWSGSRAPSLAVAAGLVVWFVLADKATRLALLKWAPAMVVTALCISRLLGAPFGGMGWWAAVSRTAAATDIDSVSSDRIVIWVKVWGEILKAPVFGNGPDAYIYIIPKQTAEQVHNCLLQWLLDFGFFGAIPLLGLLALQVGRALAKRSSIQLFAAASILGALCCGLFDGVFYYGVSLVPLIVLMGATSAADSGELRKIPATEPSLVLIGRLGAAVAALTLTLHGWLYYSLVAGSPPEPDSVTAKIFRKFPSPSLGFTRWLDKWELRRPDVALEWSLWAQRALPTPAVFHWYAATYYEGLMQLDKVDAELVSAVATTNAWSKADFEQKLVNFRAARAKYENSLRAKSSPAAKDGDDTPASAQQPASAP